MAKRSLIDQLDEAVEAVMAKPKSPLPRVGPRLAAILRVAADLRDLPSPEFKRRLKADLLSPKPPTRPGRGRAKVASIRKAESKPALRTVATTCLVIKDAHRALDFYKTAFGATELMRL